MALITCPDCYKSVSDTAQSCPGCGHNIAGSLDSRRKWLESPEGRVGKQKYEQVKQKREKWADAGLCQTCGATIVKSLINNSNTECTTCVVSHQTRKCPLCYSYYDRKKLPHDKYEERYCEHCKYYDNPSLYKD